MKRKRVNGFVVGRRRRHGESKWFVRVEQDGHPLDGATLMASPGYGVAMVPSLKVDFYLGQAGDQPVATDVLPRGDKQQREITMRNSILKYVASAAIAVLAIVATLAAVYKPWEWKEVKDQLLVLRVESAFDRMKGKAFAELIPDRVIEQAMKSPHVGTYSAREAALDEYLCMPVFGHKHSDRFGPKKDQPGQCYHAIYDAKSGDPDWRLANDGLPIAIGMPIRSLRQGLFEVARVHLRDPDHLNEFYRAKKSVALTAYWSLSKEERAERKAKLQEALRQFALFTGDPTLRGAMTVYLDAERVWLHEIVNQGRSELSNALWKKYEEARTVLSQAAGLDGDMPHWALFAQRRQYEGGDALVWAYVNMARDFYDAILGADSSKNR